MNNLTLTLHSQEPELGEIISDASSNPIIKVEMEPYYAPVPVWKASFEFNGRTYRLYARGVVNEEPDQELIEIYEKYALDDEANVPIDFYRDYLGEIDGILNRGTKPSGKYTQAMQIHRLVQAVANFEDEPEHDWHQHEVSEPEKCQCVKLCADCFRVVE